MASPHHCAGPSLPCWCVCVSASASSSPTQSVPGRATRPRHCSPQTLRWHGSKPLTVWPSGCIWGPPSIPSLLSCGFSHCSSHKASSCQSQVSRLGLAVPVPLPGIRWYLKTSDFALLESSFLFTGKPFWPPCFMTQAISTHAHSWPPQRPFPLILLFHICNTLLSLSLSLCVWEGMCAWYIQMCICILCPDVRAWSEDDARFPFLCLSTLFL